MPLKPHICICICTFKRPNLLKKLLDILKFQVTEDLFSYSIVITDNDANKSAEQVVADYKSSSSVPIVYSLEPVQNFALARNKTLEHAQGDFIAFIDDDEFPENDWLLNLFKTCESYQVDGVLGPVKPFFVNPAPKWVIKGKIFIRPEHKTGHVLGWHETRTGNVLFRKSILNAVSIPFRPKFGTGSEDVDFFRRMIHNGYKFIWSNEAVVYENIPPSRCKRGYLIRLALLRGGDSFKHEKTKHSLFKSFFAIPIYGLILPLFLIIREHHFMKFLISFFDHIGRMSALFGFHPVKHRPI